MKSVESYDHHENKWSFLSDMNVAKKYHYATSLGNKMFVTDVDNLARSEVYDNISRKFTLFNIKRPVGQFTRSNFKILRISNKFILFADSYRSLQLYVYNVDKNKWVFEKNLQKENFNFPAYCSFEKLPKL